MNDQQGCKFTPNHGRCCALQTPEFHSSNMDTDIKNFVIHTAGWLFCTNSGPKTKWCLHAQIYENPLLQRWCTGNSRESIECRIWKVFKTIQRSRYNVQLIQFSDSFHFGILQVLSAPLSRYTNQIILPGTPRLEKPRYQTCVLYQGSWLHVGFFVSTSSHKLVYCKWELRKKNLWPHLLWVPKD